MGSKESGELRLGKLTAGEVGDWGFVILSFIREEKTMFNFITSPYYKTYLFITSRMTDFLNLLKHVCLLFIRSLTTFPSEKQLTIYFFSEATTSRHQYFLAFLSWLSLPHLRSLVSPTLSV